MTLSTFIFCFPGYTQDVTELSVTELDQVVGTNGDVLALVYTEMVFGTYLYIYFVL